MRAQGCDAVILACTELSVLNVNYSLNPDFYIDAMNVVAKACIENAVVYTASKFATTN